MQRLLVADGLDDGVRAVGAQQVADLLLALLAALGDDVGGAELAAQVGAGAVAAHEHDPLGAQPPRGEHGEQPDGTVAHDHDVLARADLPSGA